MRQALMEVIGMPAEQAKAFASHSCRRGGASASAKRVPSRLLRRHAGVKSANWVDGYADPDSDEELAVSRAIGASLHDAPSGVISC